MAPTSSKKWSEQDWIDSAYGEVQYGHRKHKRCYESHPALILPNSPDLVIYGGSCGFPIVEDADVYVGFEQGMKVPEFTGVINPAVNLKLPVPDMGVPKDLNVYKQLLEYTHTALLDGRKVHAGCIGGHGRTGMFFAALVAFKFDEPDAIHYVREHYCEKVVESTSQVDWLHKHFGVVKAKSSKSYTNHKPAKSLPKGKPTKKVRTIDNDEVMPMAIHSFTPLPNKGQVW